MQIAVHVWLVLAFWLGPTAAYAQDQPAAGEHVAPAGPQQPMPQMSEAQMKSLMDMDDDASFAMFKLDELERGRSGDAYSTTWNAQGWYGGDIDKVWLRTEGQRELQITDARMEAFWDHAFASYWDFQLGARRDIVDAPRAGGSGRNWAAFGVQGIAPYGFDIEATAYVASDGRTAARFRIEYEMLLSQRLILTPELELNAYGKSDRASEVAAGLSHAEFGLRLRYEVERKFAPYAGLVWDYRRASESSAGRAPGATGTQLQFVIGVRLWL